MSQSTNENSKQQLVIFNLTDQTFGVDIISVQEIIKKVPITPVPRTQEFVKGVINLRGKIIPVLDLYQRLGLDHPADNSDWRIIILELKDTIVGILVDGVSEVLSLNSENIEIGNELAMGVDSKYIKGIGKWKESLIIILDLEIVLDIVRNGEITAEVG